MWVLLNILRLMFLIFAVLFSKVFWLIIYSKICTKTCLLKQNEKFDSILGKEICRLMQKLGPSYIKLGQFLSTRPDVIGFEMSNELALLQDRLPAFDGKKATASIEKQLNAKIDDLFEIFDFAPVAAASIAQVHKAKTKSGQWVAVKVLRPKVEKIIHGDLSLFKMIAFILQLFSKEARRLKFVEVVKKLKQVVDIEMDLRIEAASYDTIRNNVAADPNVIIPKIYWEYSSKRVLTSQWCEGVSANDKDALYKLNINLHDVAQHIAVTFFNQAFNDGIFHADLHPGNILINNKGQIILVDFGIVGFLDEQSRIFVAEMLHGFINRDYYRVADLHFEIGYVPPNQSKELFALACRSIGEPIIGQPVNKISVAKLLQQLFEISGKFEIKLQPQLILLQKTLVTIEGVGYSLYPDVNMWELAKPWINKWGKKNISTMAKLHRSARHLNSIITELPKTIQKVENIISSIDRDMRKKEKKKQKP